MSKNNGASRSADETVLLVDLPSVLRQQFNIMAPPPVATLRVHAYDLRFAYTRLPSGKLAVMQKDLAQIAALYAVHTGNIRTAA